MTFCRRRCAVQSRSPRWIALPCAIGEDLDLDVAAVLDQALEHQRAVAEGALRPRAARRRARRAVSPSVAHQPHAAAAAAGHGLDQQREAEPRGLGRAASRRPGPRRGSRARRARRRRSCGAWRRALSPIAVMRRGGRADEDEAGVRAGLREVGVLAEEAVAGVHRIGAGAARGLQQRVDAQVGLGRRRARRCARPRRPARHAGRRRRRRCTRRPCGSRACAPCGSRGRRSRRGSRSGSCGSSLRRPASPCASAGRRSCPRCPRAQRRARERPRRRPAPATAGVLAARLAPSAPWSRRCAPGAHARMSASTRCERGVECVGRRAPRAPGRSRSASAASRRPPVTARRLACE